MSDLLAPFVDPPHAPIWLYPDGKGFGKRGVRNLPAWNALAAARRQHVDVATAWRLDALQDGWHQEPTYPSEPAEHAFRLTRDGFLVQGLARPGQEEREPWTLPTASITIWGPDKLQVRAPLPYSFERIVAGVRHCHSCEAEDVDTKRLAFAGRVCLKCHDAEWAKLPPNWCA